MWHIPDCIDMRQREPSEMIKYKRELSAAVLAESSIIYFIISLGSFRYSDVCICESGRCHTLPFFLTFFIINLSRFFFCINISSLFVFFIVIVIVNLHQADHSNWDMKFRSIKYVINIQDNTYKGINYFKRLKILTHNWWLRKSI